MNCSVYGNGCFLFENMKKSPNIQSEVMCVGDLFAMTGRRMHCTIESSVEFGCLLNILNISPEFVAEHIACVAQNG